MPVQHWRAHRSQRCTMFPGEPAQVRSSVEFPGSVQVCFLGPELGPLESLLVAPEGGDWYLEEANVSSSRTGHSDRCACLRTGWPAKPSLSSRRYIVDLLHHITAV